VKKSGSSAARAQLLYRFLASVGLARRQYDLRAAAGQLAADFEADSAIPSGNDDDRPVPGHGRHSWRRSLNA
jgi:hypothetical protein